MRFLVLDPFGDGLDVSLRAHREGHQVKHFIPDNPKYAKIGQGMVPITREFKPWLRWADCVFLVDNTIYMTDIDNHRLSMPNNVLGPSRETTLWETDRKIGQQVLRTAGIQTIPYKEFVAYEDAIAYCKKHDKRFVSKPTDEDDKALSYVSKSPDDMLYMLERWKKLGKKMKFILQDFVEGCEMAAGGFYGPGGWINGWHENFEFKKFMNNELGIATGEQGTVVRVVRKSKLAEEMLIPLTEQLRKSNYVGYIDVNCIITDEGKAWPLELTCRPGWPTYNIQLALLKGDSVNWLKDLLAGKDTATWIYDEVAVGVVLSVPDYPYSHVTRREVCEIPIYGIKPGLWKHIHPAEMMMCEAPLKNNGAVIRTSMPATAGDYVMVMTGVAATVKDAANTAYRRLANLIVPNSPMYRTDIGRRLAKQLPKIQPHGYARGMVYTTAT
jgi:phosphoribosylamine--glycine ligase